MPPWRVHGLHVVDVVDGECRPVFLTSGQARDRRGGGEGPSGLPLRSGKPVISRRGRPLLGDRNKYEGLHPLVFEGLHPWVERSMVGTNYEGADLGIALIIIVVVP